MKSSDRSSKRSMGSTGGLKTSCCSRSYSSRGIKKGEFMVGASISKSLMRLKIS